MKPPNCDACGRHMIRNGATDDGRTRWVCRRHAPSRSATAESRRAGSFGKGRIKRRPPPCPKCGGSHRSWKKTSPGRRFQAYCTNCKCSRSLSDQEQQAIAMDIPYPDRTWDDELVVKARGRWHFL